MAFVAFVFLFLDLEEKVEVDIPFASTGIPTNGDSGIHPVSAEERTIVLSEKRRGRYGRSNATHATHASKSYGVRL